MEDRASFFNAVQKFAKLPPADREKIVAEVEAQAVFLSIQELAAVVAKGISGVRESMLEALFKGIAPLVPYVIRAPEVGQNLVSAFVEDDPDATVSFGDGGEQVSFDASGF